MELFTMVMAEEPTLWIRGHDKLHGILDMAVALRKFQTAAQAFIAEHGEVGP